MLLPSTAETSAASVEVVAEGLIQLTPPAQRTSGRFAPSPTGPLHIGNLRTALIAWCCARTTGSSFVIRVEDLDRERCRPGSAAQQLGDLTAIGLDWDGPVLAQSQRSELYRAALEQLRSADLLYECWCTRAEIREAASAPHGAVATYPGTCLSLSSAERAERQRSGRQPALRVRAQRASIEFTDRIHGIQGGVVDDFIVTRNDGSFSYQLAVVADDGDQNIDEVVRGDDLLTSTAAQCWLAQQLGLPRPSYVHIPLMRGDDGKRLSKRDKSMTLQGQRALGRRAERVRSELAASLGLCEPGETLSNAQLLSRYDAILVESLP